MATLLDVNRQWSSRPEDETFDSIETAYAASLAFYQATKERADVVPSTLRLEADKDDVILVGKGGHGAHLTHWAFGQLSSLVGAPASYLRQLPATLAAQNINYGMKEKFGTAAAPRDEQDKVNMLFTKQNEDRLLVRSINSDIYSRIWNHELLLRLIDLKNYGWHNPRPFNKGAEVGTVWVSDKDMFVFQVNDSNLVNAGKDADGNVRMLRRGFIMSNSEVGGGAWKTKAFLFDYMCCNRMIWGAQDISEISVRHIHNAADKVGAIMSQFLIEVQKYLNSSAQDEELKIASAKRTIIASTKEDVMDKVFAILKGQISRKALDSSYETARTLPDTDAPLNSVWALSNGMTRYSQNIPYADERTKVDSAAGRLVELVAKF